MSDAIRIGTRSSELALRQARIVQAALLERGLESELVTYRTLGDKRLDEPLSTIGAKGLFTKELEVDLRKGKTDLAVHSLKDLPTDSPPGLIVAAVLEREDPRDALVLNRGIMGQSLDDLPRGSRVGTSSLRRRAQLLATRPDLEVAELRGNVPTRLRKVDEGRVHAAILAAAGLHRLGAHQHITCYLDAPAWLPAAGQGAIAIQVRDDDARIRELAESLNDLPTMLAVRAERAFLQALEGGCQVPIGALAVPADAKVRVNATLNATGVDADAAGKARLTLRSASDGKFEIAVRHLERDATYEVVIGGVRVADLTTNGGGNGKLRFRSRPRSSRDLPLGFDPRTATVVVRDGVGDDVLAVSFPDDDVPNDGDIVCCIPDDSGTECEDRTADECTAQGGTAIAGATSCLPNPCAGATPVDDDADIVCCIPDDSGAECEDRTQDECLAAGGTIVSATSCDPNPCAAVPPTGGDVVCCLPDNGGDGANECET
jgi:hydroxymethylbilane synthase